MSVAPKAFLSEPRTNLCGRHHTGRYDESVRAETNRIKQEEELQYRKYCEQRAATSAALRINPFKFPLTRLPLELQLMVLKNCLCTTKPLLNYGFKVEGPKLTVRGEPRAQAETGVNLLRTCRLYRQAGMKYLMEHTFIYTPIYREDQKPRPASCCCQPKKYYISEFPTYHPLAPRPNLKHLNLRLGPHDHSGEVLDTIFKIKRWLSKNP